MKGLAMEGERIRTQEEILSELNMTGRVELRDGESVRVSSHLLELIMFTVLTCAVWFMLGFSIGRDW